MNNIDKTQTLGQVVAKYPYVADVLNKYKIDFSFRGETTLENAVKERDLPENDVIGELDLAVDEFKLMKTPVIYWENEPIDKILDFIEGHHHVFMSETLKKIKTLFTPPSAEWTDRAKEHYLKLGELFDRLNEDMSAHQEKEEKNLFPRLREYSVKRSKVLRDNIVRYMTDTEDEHDEAGRLFKEINDLTDNFTLPDFFPDSWKGIYDLLDALEKDTFLHIHMENSILFKMI